MLEVADAAAARTLLAAAAASHTHAQADVTNLTTDLAAKQPLDATLTALAGLTTAADRGIYFTGVDTATVFTLTSFARTILDDTSASAARTTLGVGTGDSPQFTAVNVGHASDTTLARSGAGELTVEGNRIFRVGGADVPVADGGTGASDAATARTNLGAAADAAPAAGVYHNAAQSIGNFVTTALAFNSERFDNASLHDTATNNSRLTAPVAGLYQITGCMEWASGAGSLRAIGLRVNGTTIIAVDYSGPIGGGLATAQSISALYKLAAGDYVELVVLQDSGGALNVNASGNYSPEFAMARVGTG